MHETFAQAPAHPALTLWFAVLAVSVVSVEIFVSAAVGHQTGDVGIGFDVLTVVPFSFVMSTVPPLPPLGTEQ